MQVDLLKEDDYETYADEVDTDKASTQYLLNIAMSLVTGEMRIIQYLEPSEKTLGKKLFQLYKEIKEIEERNSEKKTVAAKKGWKTRRNRCK